MEEELLFRFVGFDELSDTLRDISSNLDRVADNSDRTVSQLNQLNAAFMALRVGVGFVERAIDKVADQMRQLNTNTLAMGATMTLVAGAVDRLADNMNQLD